MIDAILGRVTGFFEKDFLFASFLPALLFLLATAGTVLAVAGAPPALAGFDGWSTGRLSFALFAGLVAVTIFAYVLVAARPALLALWSGTAPLLGLVPGLMALARWRQLRAFRAMTADALADSAWLPAMRTFQDEALTVWPPQANARDLTDAEKRDVAQAVAAARASWTPADFLAATVPFFKALNIAGGPRLEATYAALQDVLREREEVESVRTQATAVALDRKFGSFGTVRPTALGNVITSYQEYPAKRYGIEAEAFWPQLRAVIPPPYFQVVQEPRILMDFAVTMASLCVALAVLAGVAGPWLTYRPALWIGAAVGGLGIAYFFYRIAVSAAEHVGEFVRACFDLYRLDLMASLHRPDPPNSAVERAQWAELSQIAVFGETGHEVVLTPVTPPPSSSRGTGAP